MGMGSHCASVAKKPAAMRRDSHDTCHVHQFGDWAHSHYNISPDARKVYQTEEETCTCYDRRYHELQQHLHEGNTRMTD
eukprot:8602727-Karenia_brevis.AAC.1